MIEAAREILMRFDTLSPADQEEVAAAILGRAASSDDLPEDALRVLAEELFRSYESEEGSDADTAAR